MDSTSIIVVALLGLAFVQPVTAEKAPRKIEKLVAQNIEKAVAKVRVEDDPLEPIIRITTKYLHKQKSDDLWLEAVIDRDSNKTRFFLAGEIGYIGGLQRFLAINYPVEGRITSNDVSQRHISYKCTSAGALGRYCYSETLVQHQFDEQKFEQLASRYIAGSTESLPFRLKTNAGENHDHRIYLIEMAALKTKIDEFSSMFKQDGDQNSK